MRFLERQDRVRVLYVFHHHEFSGAETLQEPLLRADPDALVACPAGSSIESFVRDLGIPTVPLPYRPLRHSGGLLETLRSVFRGFAAARDLRWILRRHPERGIVYCVAIRPAMLAALARLRLERRVVWTVPDLMPPAPLRQAVRLLARVGCDRAIALSQVIADDFAGRSRTLQGLVTVIHPGPDLRRFVPPDGAPRPPRIAVLGAISPTKQTHVALEVARRLRDAGAEFQLDIIGRAQFRDEDFAYERRLHDEVREDPRLEGNVRFLGYSTRVEEQLAEYRILLHCRPDEPFGMVVVEAMAAGLAVVAPGTAGPSEIVEHGSTGFLYAPGDADEAAGYVLRLLRDAELAAAMGLAGRDLAARRFSADIQVEAIDRLLSELAR